jgi:GcrA cell cycle regulator
MKSKEGKMSWTDDRINLLKRMWKEGKSAAEIAKVLGKGVTRNAVIGKAHRMGLSGRPSPIKKPEPVAKKAAPVAAAPKKAAPAPAAPAKSGAKKSTPVAPPPASNKNAAAPAPEEIKRIDRKEIIPPGGGVNLIDLSERMCKWPIGDPREADFTFCGLAIRPGTPYCPGHASMAYQSSSRRGQVVAVAVEKEEVEVDEVEVEVDEDEEEVEAVE